MHKNKNRVRRQLIEKWLYLYHYAQRHPNLDIIKSLVRFEEMTKA